MAENKKTEEPKPDCFVIMPISDPDTHEKGHFRSVYKNIFRVAIDKAGFNPVRADDVKNTNLIHLDILRKLIDSPMAVCDLSSRNPNVMFELGLRQAFDKPTVLVREEGTPDIFDIAPLRITTYKGIKYEDVLQAQKDVAEAIIETKNATDSKDGVNSLIQLLSLSNPAALRNVSDNGTMQMLQVIMAEVSSIKSDIRNKEQQQLAELRKFSITEGVEGDFFTAELLLDKLRDQVSENSKYLDVYETYSSLQRITHRLEAANLSPEGRRLLNELVTEMERLLNLTVLRTL